MRAVLVRMARVALLLAAAVIGVPGCGSGSVADGSPPEPGGTRNPPAAPTEITVTEARAAAIVAAVTGAKGKVVVVDFWATWCGPCVKKFPHLVELHHAHGADGLVCVSVSMDKWEHAQEYQEENGKQKVLDFLKAKGATFPNFIAVDPDGELDQLQAKFGEFAGIPHMAVFDKSGRRVWDSGSGERLSDDQLDKMIADQLAR